MNIYILTDNNFLYHGLSSLWCSEVNLLKINNITMYIPDNSIVLIDIDSSMNASFLNMDWASKPIYKIFLSVNLERNVVLFNGVVVVNLKGNAKVSNYIIRNLISDWSFMKSKKAFTHSEMAVISWLLKGWNYSKISSVMNIKKKTVYTHVQNIQNKIGCKGMHSFFLLKCPIRHSIKRKYNV
ncbi:helix-turn-helix domain-containing protein [Klebsiella pneumoniae]|uniref:helix-turn-helix domain-containing protein n=1 Tax=Klebsiella pneumoniae TaxID=573 RepID=UPI0040555511